MNIGNWPLVMLTIEHVIKHPRNHDQRAWRKRSALICESTRCIAGWLAYFAGWRDTDSNPDDKFWMPFDVERNGITLTIEQAALESLELDPEIYDDSSESDYATALTEDLFSADLDFDEILATIWQLSQADGVTLTPLIRSEMVRQGVISEQMAGF